MDSDSTKPSRSRTCSSTSWAGFSASNRWNSASFSRRAISSALATHGAHRPGSAQRYMRGSGASAPAGSRAARTTRVPGMGRNIASTPPSSKAARSASWLNRRTSASTFCSATASGASPSSSSKSSSGVPALSRAHSASSSSARMRPACISACTGVWNPKPSRVPTRSPPWRNSSASRPPACSVSRPVERDLWAE
nr:hypothetical protein [Archangium gephyra]